MKVSKPHRMKAQRPPSPPIQEKNPHKTEIKLTIQRPRTTPHESQNQPQTPREWPQPRQDPQQTIL